MVDRHLDPMRRANFRPRRSTRQSLSWRMRCAPRRLRDVADQVALQCGRYRVGECLGLHRNDRLRTDSVAQDAQPDEL